MAKSRPRFMDTKPADFFIKWMSRVNTYMYRRSDGEGFGSARLPGARALNQRMVRTRCQALDKIIIPSALCG